MAIMIFAFFCLHSCSKLWEFIAKQSVKMVAILMLLTNHAEMGNTGKKTGWYLPEMAHPYHEFKKAGFEITLVSPKGGKAPMVSSVNALYAGVLLAFANFTWCQIQGA